MPRPCSLANAQDADSGLSEHFRTALAGLVIDHGLRDEPTTCLVTLDRRQSTLAAELAGLDSQLILPT
jgi:hypothetical protein